MATGRRCRQAARGVQDRRPGGLRLRGRRPRKGAGPLARGARFGPDVLEAAARRAVEAWAEAVDGKDAPLERLASREAVDELLYAGDSSRETRLVLRGPGVR